MGKKKSKATKHQQPFSAKRYITENVRKLPIGKCYIDGDWEDAGEANIMITRCHKQGTFTIGVYLVDTSCIGVKDSLYRFSITQEELDEIIEHMSSSGADYIEIPYEEAHNIIFGAIEFAEEAGIKPDKTFNITKYILEEDTDDIPLIEYEFGKDGQHCLVANSNLELTKYLPTLKKNLGDDFKYMINVDDEDEDEDEAPYDFNKSDDPLENYIHIEEEYSYKHPDYSTELDLKHPELMDMLKGDGKTIYLNKAEIDKVLAIPHDELKEDINKLMLYCLGCGFDYDRPGDMLPNCMVFLTEIGDESSLDIILETLRQDIDFSDFHFGDIADNYYVPVIAELGKGHLDKLFAFLHEPGLSYYMRYFVIQATSLMINIYPEMRKDIIKRLRELLKFYIKALPEGKGCDSDIAGLFLSNLLDIHATELIHEIKELFDTNMVATTICGNEDSFIFDLNNLHYPRECDYQTDIYKHYEQIKEISKHLSYN